ncbi:hypothetical protein KX928_12570 [Roseobacter sp. YSTF-M11]|uniref:Uncharacterized protein n=1 Tax=Roseobacter insulae TaxID=2859783 RepID=A0A9X1FVW4_9RHOB|nr:hypothetical protein [Roseobacter insulae]MBW4708618.1 hypothetical protein [Roseobacter insulae]
MPVSFPMSIAEFLDALPVKSVEFDLPEAVQTSRTAGGEILPEDIGTRLWQGEVMLGRLLPYEALDAQALIDLMRGAGASFLAYHTRFPHPRQDPTGSIIAGASPQIAALDGGDARLISLKGLTPGYALTRGDYLSFTYGSNPLRYGLHRVQETQVLADGAGTTPLFEVIPPLEPGAVIDAAVTLGRAHCKAVIVPDSVQTGRQSKFLRDGMSFKFMQTLR